MSTAPRIVFDTSTLVAVCIYPDREPAHIFRKALLRFEAVASPETLEEISIVLARPKFNAWRSAEQRQEWVKQYTMSVNEVASSVTITDCRDDKDNKFLELAVSSTASVIISSDDDLLDLHPYNGIQIITLRELSDRLLNRRLE